VEAMVVDYLTSFWGTLLLFFLLFIYDANSCLTRLIETLLLSKACYFALLFNSFFGLDYQAYG